MGLKTRVGLILSHIFINYGEQVSSIKLVSAFSRLTKVSLPEKQEGPFPSSRITLVLFVELIMIN
jgi:hypothetical protein